MMENTSDRSLIFERLDRIRDSMAEACLQCGRRPEDVTLMAVTKTVPAERVNLAIDWGIRLLGENRAQELCAKYDGYQLKRENIHFIGHLQTNKVKSIIDKVDMIHSVDSLKLAAEIDKLSAAHGRAMKILVEVNGEKQESKSGVYPEDLPGFLDELGQFSHLQVCGLMTIPPVAQNEAEKEKFFSKVFQLFIDNKAKKTDNINMSVLSMGMSGDYEAAIRNGSTIVRLGSAIFGPRL